MQPIRTVRILGCCSRLRQKFLIFVSLGALLAYRVLGDGCFVFKWNKQIDINEPTQKAIIVYDNGREDLLLQVRYEGPLNEFGWLIPVPALPDVEKGSMEPFYELSELTQRRWTPLRVALAGTPEIERVTVVEVKTVGAYEVAILSPKDADSLGQWLQSHDYAIPPLKAGILDEYIHKNWYFVAAKIRLDPEVDFKMVSPPNGRNEGPPDKGQDTVQQQLSKGELHPILISFDAEHCVFPLKISAVGGKPSEISLYVLSTEPLINHAIFDTEWAKLSEERAKWEDDREKNAKKYAANARISAQNARSLGLAWRMYTLDPLWGSGQRHSRDWTLEDLQNLGDEIQPLPTTSLRDEGFYPAASRQLLECMAVDAEKIPRTGQQFRRIQNRHWYLTKLARTFAADQMEDLQFDAATPVLAAVLPTAEGRVAAGLLSQLGTNAVSALFSACHSDDSRTRINASSGLQSVQKQVPASLLISLLKDDVPKVRLNAVMATAPNWDDQMRDPLIALFRDQQREIRWQAAQWLSLHESSERAPVYLELLRENDPNVQACALQVLNKIAPTNIPRSDLLRLLGSPRMEVVSQALTLLRVPSIWLSEPAASGPYGSRAIEEPLSSEEAAPLTANQLTIARLAGIKVLYKNHDAAAVGLAIPMLSDTNAIVRDRAFAFLYKVTGQEIPLQDRARWEKWWSEHCSTFQAKTP